MLNPDRAEFRLQPTPVPENSRKNGYIPRWLRAPIFAARTSLAILTATPGMVLLHNTINGIENSPIVYDSGQKVTMYSQYDFDQPLTPTATAQPPEVYKLYLNSSHYVIRGFRDEPNFRGDFPIDRSRTIDAGIANRNVFPIDESRMIDNWGRTHIFLKVGQTLEISATGRMLLNDLYYEERYVKSCNDSNLIDPDGYRYWRDTVCPPDKQSQMVKIHGAPRGMLIGNISERGPGYEPRILIGSHWKGSVDRDGYLYLQTNISTSYGTSGGFDITVNVYPSNSTPTSVPSARPAFTPEPIRTTVPEIRPTQTVPIGRPTTPTEIPSWLWGLGVASLAGLAAYWGYERGKRKNLPSPPPPLPPLPFPGSRGPNPNTGPATAPNMGPTQPKNPEWIIGQKEFERRWQDVKSKLPPVRLGDTGNEQGYILDRFKAGMSIIHEVSLEDAANVPEMDTRLRAGIEYLTAEIWPDKRIFRRFFDPGFNAGLLTPENLARIIYIPESYRHLSIFTKAQKRDINRIHRTLLHALHPDLLKKDSDPKLQDSMDLLLRQLNSAWSLINKLIS